MSVLFRRLFRTVIFSRFSKVAIATSNFMSEFFNGGFSPEFSVGKIQNVGETELSEEKNSVFHWRKISYFVFKYIYIYSY